MTYHPRSRGRYRKRKRCSYPGVECDELGLEDWAYCERTELIAALEANGRHDMADTIKAENLAKQLVDSGRDDLADQLTGTPTPDDAPADEGDQFVNELKAALQGNKVSLPGLLDQ